MSLIVDNVEIENIVVIKLSTGESVELDTLQDNFGNIIFKKATKIDEFIPESDGSQGLVFELNTDGTSYKVTGIDTSSFDYSISSLKIPSEHSGLPVTYISRVLIESPMPNLEEIRIGGGVTNVTTYVSDGYYDENNNYVNLTQYATFEFRQGVLSHPIFVFVPSSMVRISSSSSGNGYFIREQDSQGVTVYLNGNTLIDTIESDGSGSTNLISSAGEQVLIFGQDVTETHINIDEYTSGGMSHRQNAISGVDIINFQMKTPINITQAEFLTAVNTPIINFNGKVKKFLGTDAFTETGYTSFTIPKEIDEISGARFFNDNSLTEVVFEHSATDPLTIPENISFMYKKSATNKTIYTDKQSIADYNWGLSNITPTFYHLDRTTQWQQLATPTTALNGSILTISPVENAEYYTILSNGNTVYTSPVTTSGTEKTIDLAEIFDTAGTYPITVRAFKNTFAASQPSVSVSYTKS